MGKYYPTMVDFKAKKLLIGLLLVLFINCNKNPLGADELSGRGIGNPQFLTTIVDSFATCYTAPGQGKSLNLVLGKNQEYESRILLNFTYPDTISEDMQDIRMTLYKRNFPREDTVELNLHLVTTGWGEYYTTWFLADQELKWYHEGGDYEPAPLISKIAAGDSVTIRFTRDQLNMMKGKMGIILIPTTEGFTTFYSREGRKPIRLTYKKGDQRYDIPLISDAHIIKDWLPEPENKIWIGAGIPFRSFLYFSAFDTIVFNKKIIYSQLRMKKLFATSQRETIEIVIRPLTESFRGFASQSGSILSSKKFSLTDSIYEVDIINLLQHIANNPDSNFGFFLMTNPEDYDISRFEIKTDTIEIEMGYISPPQAR